MDEKTEARSLATAQALQTQGKLKEAETLYVALVAANTRHAAAYSGLSIIYSDAGRSEEAIELARRALALEPNLLAAQFYLATALHRTGRFEEAEEAYLRTLAIKPNFAKADLGLGTLLQLHHRTAEAVAHYRRALDHDPRDPRGYIAFMFAETMAGTMRPDEVLLIARKFEAFACQPPAVPFPNRALDPKRKLRIGIISAEIGDHPVPFFLQSYLLNRDRERFETVLYSTRSYSGPRHDEILQLPDLWRESVGVADDALRTQIIADRIDILIDTTSYMKNGRLLMLSQRCAPVQAHYIGFCSTTGVSAIDYFIGDDEVTPPEFAPHFSERLLRLPRLWVCYHPPSHLPKAQSLSAPHEVTFGSFNNLAKVGDAVLDFWGRLLAAVPSARLIVKDLRATDDDAQARFLAPIIGRGIDPKRVAFLPMAADWTVHMQLYNYVDLALDPFPLCSGTTGFDALAMGTPLIAMRGDWMGGRMSSSMLKALGRPEWIANNTEDYLAIVTRMAADKERLKGYKRTLQDEVLRSSLCDGDGLARALETGFLQMADEHNARLAS